MGAPKGNQFWKLRSKHGREKLFDTPELLWESACEYFEWCDDNPWITTESASKSSSRDTEDLTKEKPIQRPYSRAGWYLYADASDSWLREFKKTCSEDFLRVIERIEMIIDKQQWEGATVNAFNANIIARTLGLKERTDLTTNEESINVPLTPEELRQKAKDLDNDY